MTIAIHLKLVGLIMFGIVVLSFFVPRRFRWRQQLQRVSLFTRQVFFVHNLFIMLLVGMFGVLCLFFTDALLEPTRLSKVVLTGLTVFWAVRLYAQWFIYDRSLWRGQRFNTVVHFVFTAMWAYFVGVYGFAMWQQWQQV